MSTEIRTWHHGLIARWWAEFNQGGEDIEYFQRAIEQSGEPALDAGCGTGRLLLPLLRAGLDVDGCDTSADMLAWCRSDAARAELPVIVYQMAMHELDLPRRYRTVVVCGAFGLGGSRAQDLEGLKRIHRVLEPGGRLVMDHYLPNLESPRGWAAWVEKPQLPGTWPKRGDRKAASDGTELELHTRQLAFDPLQQTTTLEIRATHYADDGDRQLAVETGTIDINLYFMNEIELMLAAAGFSEIRITAFPTDRPPRAWEDRRIVFHALA